LTTTGDLLRKWSLCQHSLNTMQNHVSLASATLPIGLTEKNKNNCQQRLASTQSLAQSMLTNAILCNQIMAILNAKFHSTLKLWTFELLELSIIGSIPRDTLISQSISFQIAEISLSISETKSQTSTTRSKSHRMVNSLRCLLTHNLPQEKRAVQWCANFLTRIQAKNSV
jgi:hypothetical protein